MSTKDESPLDSLRALDAMAARDPAHSASKVDATAPVESRSRSLTKSLSWRIIATVITTLVAWNITGSFAVGAGIGLADSLVKFIAYYGHERAWLKLRTESRC